MTLHAAVGSLLDEEEDQRESSQGVIFGGPSNKWFLSERSLFGRDL